MNVIDTIVVATEWPEFKRLEDMDLKIPVIVGKRILNPEKFENYVGIGRYYGD